MALKSYRLLRKNNPRTKKKRKGFGDAGRLVGTGVTALIGIGLLSETSQAVARI